MDTSTCMIPFIETSRLKLRGHREADLPLATAMWADPTVVRHIGGLPFSEQETWSKMLRYHGLWSLLGFGYWAVEDKATKRFIGEVGFANFRREMNPSILNVPELGWALAPHAHGKGYATEALSAALAWADTSKGWNRTVCIINPDNKASIRVAIKCGFQEVQKTTYSGQPTILFERIKL